MIARSICCACLYIATSGAASAAEMFDIPPGKATLSLDAFAKQSGVNVLYKADDLAGVTTQAVTGQLDVLAAMERMLNGTNLVARRVGQNEIILVTREVQQTLVADAESRQATPGKKAPKTDDSMEKVIVTGTHIRGAYRMGSGEEGIDFDNLNVYPSPTVARTLVQLPAFHDRGETNDSATSDGNSSLGYGLNLRGLGSGSTLTLLDGHRLPASGIDAGFTDVSNIPQVIVSRIELVPDGASALYGSDAVAGVVNIITRRNTEDTFTVARYGTGIDGTLTEKQLGHVVGAKWERVSAMLAMEFYSSHQLPAAARAQVSSDLRQFGGYDFSTQLSNPGTILTARGPLAIPTNQDGTNVTPQDLTPGSNLSNLYENSDIIPAHERRSVFNSLQYDATDALKLSLDTLFTSRQARAATGSFRGLLTVPPSNPFVQGITADNQPVFVGYDFAEDIGTKNIVADVQLHHTTATAEWELPGGRHFDAFVSHSTDREHQLTNNLVNIAEMQAALSDPDPATALNVMGDGSHTAPSTVERLRTEGHIRNASALTSAGVKLNGPLFTLNHREVDFAVGADQRRQSLSTVVRSNGAGTDTDYSLHRLVRAAYAQVDMKGVEASQSVPALDRFGFSVAGRYEDFSGAGSAFTGRMGVKWNASPWMTLSSSWSQSFRLPALGQLHEKQNGSLIQLLLDSNSPTGVSVALFEYGKNATLRPETAESWSIGLDFTPIERLSVRLNYFDIVARNRIESTNFATDLLNDPNLAFLITRNPTSERRFEVCSRTTFHGTPGACTEAPVSALVDLRLRNISVLETRGADLDGRYSLNTDYGLLKFGLLATYIIDFERAQTPHHDLVEMVDRPRQPISLRAVGSVAWQRGGFGASAVVKYVDSYTDTESEPNRHVGSWTTLDTSVQYTFEGDLSVSLGVENVTNRKPPFLNNTATGAGFDAVNADLRGMRVAVRLVKGW